MRLSCERLQLDGAIRADGTDRESGISGGGSGGEIRVETGRLTGSGTISADGGDGISTFNFGSSGSGGGRVAVYHGDASGFDLDRITAGGGGGGAPGEDGTVRLEQR
ncbi:MAG: hypothetical protein KatS3mg076_0066 [Candidatus Binatia bacterium]|nr:MAG: hypothetical protein KatS3mg076_0066 [Candidatus Binatia bacterium]